MPKISHEQIFRPIPSLWHVGSIILLQLIFYAGMSPVYPQARKELTLTAISELVKSGVSPNRVVQLVETHGIAFELDETALQQLKKAGANEPVLSAVKKMSDRYSEQKQRREQQEEAVKRRAEQEAKRREVEKFRAEQEQRQQAELARKKQEEAERLAQQAMQRQQDEARRKEDEGRRAVEQQRQQAEAEKAKQAKEQRRLEEERLAEEKRRIEEEARRREVERKRDDEMLAQNRAATAVKKKLEQDKRRAEAESRMLDALKNGNTAAPTYNDGDMWHFNVVENFVGETSRALKGVYEVRYSGKRFQVFKEQEPVTANEAQVGILFALFGRGNYMGGQYMKFPMSVGQKWSQQYQSGVRASRIVLTWNSEATVRSLENVTTSAGNFWALKIVREEWNHRGGSATFTYFYSPQTKSIIRMLWEWSDSSRTVELMKFEVSR